MMADQELDGLGGGIKKPNPAKTNVKKVKFPALKKEPGITHAKVPISFIDNVVVDICAELGEATLKVKDILNMQEGTVIELEKAAGDTVNLKVNHQEFARGEVIIIGNNLGVRVDRVLDARQNQGDKKEDQHE